MKPISHSVSKRTQRGDFLLPLVAGWNAISIPADPIDPAIENVLTDPAIEAIIVVGT